MKIAIIIDLWSEGGGNIFVQKLKTALEKQNHETQILTNNKKLATTQIPLSEKGGIFRLLGIPKAKQKIEKEIKKINPDKVLILSPSAALASPDIINQTNFQTIYAPRYLALQHWKNIENKITGKIKQTIEEMSLRLDYDQIFALTKNMKERMKKAGAKSPIKIIPIGVDIEKFKPKQKTKDEKTILFTGRFEPVKGIKTFVEASKRIKDAKFVMVGDKGEKLGEIPSSVKVLGRVSHEKMIDLYNEALVLAMPSFSEGLPRVGLEALSCGTPIVASKVGGIPDIVIPEKTGILIEPGSTNQLVQGIKKLLKNPKLSKEMGKNGRDLIMKKYDEKKTMKKTIEAITKN